MQNKVGEIRFEKNKWFEDLFFTHKVFYKCKRLVASNQKNITIFEKEKEVLLRIVLVIKI